MSRVAKRPIRIPTGVSITINNQNVIIKGSKGTLSYSLHPLVSINHDNNQVQLSPKKLGSSADMQAATARALISNFVIGVSEGFSSKLILVGVGYRAQVQGKKLNMAVGFSHPINYDIPEGIAIEVPAQTEIVVKGVDKRLVGQVASNIRSYRPPEPYKGKGIRYEKEKIILKETKKK